MQSQSYTATSETDDKLENTVNVEDLLCNKKNQKKRARTNSPATVRLRAKA